MTPLRFSTLGITLVLILGLLGCSQRKDPLPPDIFGRWVTTDERYSGRYFELHADGQIAFGQGTLVPHGGQMQSVQHKPSKQCAARYEISYLDSEETEFQVALLFAPNLNSFQFDNSSKVRWVKAEPTP